MKTWFKKLFEAPQWKVVFKDSMRGVRRNVFGSVEINLYMIVKVDEKRRKYKCYITDGDIKQDFNIISAMIQFPELEDIISKYDFIELI